MESLGIALISTNTFPTPPANYGGEVAPYHLAKSLDEMGHRVELYATPGSYMPPHGDLFFMRSSYGTSVPWFYECEQEVYDQYKAKILAADVVHDYSHTKRVGENLWRIDHKTNQVNTLWGSVWYHPDHGGNIIVWSEAMRQMGLKGWTGYEGGPYAHLGGKSGTIREAHVVPGCTDTDFYTPEYDKDDYFLWYARAHPSKGYSVAIELAKRTGIPLKVMHLRPEHAASPDHRQGILHAMELAKGVPNIEFVWLPRGKGHHEMKRQVLQKAKALLYTIQFQECFGLVVVEALSCGTPVIAANMGSMPEIVEHGRNGYLYSTWPELEAIVPEVEKIRPEECRRDAVVRFDRRVMASSYVREYRKVMAGEVWGA